MTWDQFKAHVDSLLAADGRDGSAPLEYIKYFSRGEHDICVSIPVGTDEKLQIWNS